MNETVQYADKLSTEGLKVIYATYLDHQPTIQYPIEFIMSEIPNLVVYSSDKENHDYLLDQNIQSNIINFKITDPTSISVAQNKCLEDALARYSPDFVVWIQADTYITPEGHTLINDFCVRENLSKVISLTVKHIRLYYLAHTTYFGITVIGKDCPKRFVGDGAYVENPEIRGNEISSVDVGYLSIDQYRRHAKQHEITWKNRAKFAHLPEKEFVKAALQYDSREIAGKGMIQPGDIYYSIVERMGLVEDYKKVKNYAS